MQLTFILRLLCHFRSINVINYSWSISLILLTREPTKEPHCIDNQSSLKARQN